MHAPGREHALHPRRPPSSAQPSRPRARLCAGGRGARPPGRVKLDPHARAAGVAGDRRRQLAWRRTRARRSQCVGPGQNFLRGGHQGPNEEAGRRTPPRAAPPPARQPPGRCPSARSARVADTDQRAAVRSRPVLRQVPAGVGATPDPARGMRVAPLRQACSTSSLAARPEHAALAGCSATPCRQAADAFRKCAHVLERF